MRTAVLGALAVGLAAPGCGGSAAAPPKPLPELYEPCDSACAAGHCEWVGAISPTGTACLSTCGATSDCPPTKNGGATLCLEGWCRPTACAGEIPPTDPPYACDQGTLRRCHEIASPSCFVCPCGPTQYCDESTGACRELKQDGQPCTTSEECPSGTCGRLPLEDGTDVLDGKSYCRLPLGAPCWYGDPCYCQDGACRLTCHIDSECGNGTVCVYSSFTGSGDCYRSCEASAAVCTGDSTCRDITANSPVAPVYVCTAPPNAPRPPRAEGVPCNTDPECMSGTCCPAPPGDDWGHCAGPTGCPQ